MGLFKVSTVQVLRGYEDLDRSVQPQGAEEHLTVKGCIP
jgi:hypothetical protein